MLVFVATRDYTCSRCRKIIREGTYVVSKYYNPKCYLEQRFILG